MNKKSLFALLVSVLTLSSCVDPQPTPTPQPTPAPEESVTSEQSSTSKESTTPEVTTTPEQSSTPEQSTTPEDSSTPEQSSTLEESTTPQDSFIPEPSEVYVETPKIFLAGDSTVKTYNDNQYIAGWGQYLDLFLKDEIEVINCANGGRSSRSFINEGRLFNIDDSSFSYNFSQNDGKSIEDCIQEGDFLFIQFGHNDDNTKLASTYTTIFDRMVPLGEPDANGIYPVTPAVKSKTTSLPYLAISSNALLSSESLA